MIAGLLNEIVTIWSPVTTVNKYGERIEEWVKLYKTRARVDSAAGNRGEQNSEIVYLYSYNFTLRSYVPIKETYQIEWQGNRYRILTIEKRREYNDIYVRAEKINT